MSQASERLLARMGRLVGATLTVPQRRRFAEYAQALLLPSCLPSTSDRRQPKRASTLIPAPRPHSVT